MTDRPDEQFDDADMAELGNLVRRAHSEEISWERPPAGLWDRIAASLDPAAAAEPVPADAPAAAADVVPIGHRRRSWWTAVAAAAAVVAIGVTAALALGRDEGDGEVVSAVELDRLGPSGSGRAELVDEDGNLRLRVDTSELDAGDGYLELWLIDPSVTRLVSLGPLRPDGVYDVPSGVDPAEFPIVDVSVEPVDGDPTHSGESVLRGELPL